ncbi:DNA cytosine methyltransferase [candidate division TA06 bacterium]|nr:DNA cytosine methyltransferase [candidate division TA06 bacterium]
MIYRMGELFCGPGGLALGAKSVIVKKDGVSFYIKPAWANDYDKDTCDTYKLNMGNDCEVICEDVSKINLAKLSPIDGLAFGFPCNDFSVVGKQKGMNGHFGPLYTYGVKILKHHQPKWFLAENVGGLANANDGTAFKTILKELFDCNYNITPHLYKFEYYGVPQARHRVIIVGIHKSCKLFFKVPQIITPKPITCKQAITQPHIPQNAPNNELTKQNEVVIERLKHIRPGENAFTAKLPKELTLNIHGATISQIYKRLDPNKPAYTITGSGGGGTHVYHWAENRALTNRERARLQTFPDNFIFKGSKESVRKQIGMAVPPEGAKIIFKAILNTLAGISYDYIEPSFEPLVHIEYSLKNYKEYEAVQLRILEKEIKYNTKNK